MPISWNEITKGSVDIRLVVSDMDGTLLDSHSEIPQDFWPLLDKMVDRGIEFVPASGRQFRTLQTMFAPQAANMSFIAENGTLVVSRDERIAITTLDDQTVNQIITRVEDAQGDIAVDAIVCGYKSAYISGSNPVFVAETSKYYKNLEVLDQLSSYQDEVLKVAMFDRNDAEKFTYQLFTDLAETHQVMLSGKNWVDIMNLEASKGLGIKALQQKLGISPNQTVIFGDYLNDLSMYDHADWTFAMQNGHPLVKERAKYLAPTNSENGLLKVLNHLIG